MSQEGSWTAYLRTRVCTRTIRGTDWVNRLDTTRVSFVGLVYCNPPGGTKVCLNTKIASCQVTIARRQGGAWGNPEQLTARQRAAFEILSDQPNPQATIRV